MNNIEKEIETCKQAVRLNPDDAEAHYNLGHAYGKSGMYKEKIESYKQDICTFLLIVMIGCLILESQ